MRIRTLLLTVCVIAALALTACAPAPEPAAMATQATEAAAAAAPTEAATEAAAVEAAAPTEGGKVIKVATQSPLSGAQSLAGTGIKNGAQLALEQYAGKLKELGYTIELAPFDDQATPDIGVANSKQIVSDPAILCVVGHYNSGVFIPSSEEYHNAGLAAVSPANTNPLVTERGYAEVNRICGRDDVQGVVGAEFAGTEMGVKSVYIIHDKSAYGQGIAEFFRQKAEELGIDVLGFEGTEEQANFDSIITPIIAANPDLVYFGGIYSQAGILFKQAREKGVTAKFMGPDGVDNPGLVELGGDAVVDMYYTTVAGPASAYPATAQFITDYETRFSEPPQPFSAQAYDSMNICLKSIEDAAAANGDSAPSRAQVTAAVRALKEFPGITGSVTFNDIGDKTSATYFVLQVGSADPALYGDNQIIKSLDIPAPSRQ